MTRLLENVRLFNSGYCRQLSYFAGRGLWGVTRFQAVFVYFEHPTHGPHLIDTGYSPLFHESTRPLPQRLYRWATPVKYHAMQESKTILGNAGIDATDLQGIFISHFHADHIGAARFHPKTPFLYQSDALSKIKKLSTRQQVTEGFLADLLPEDFEDRSTVIPDERFAADDDRLCGLASLDYWGDGSLLLVDLPGHAIGHIGFVLNTADQRLFYIVDAAWDMPAMRAGRRLPALSRWCQHDIVAYEQTQSMLREIDPQSTTMLACHCPETQAYVTPVED